MNKTLLPPTETDTLKALDIAYRSMIPNHTASLDLDPMSCDAKLLPYLAQCVQVLYWDENWTELEKRRFVSGAREVHRHIGTPFALSKMFNALDIDASLKEWYEYGGEPYHFNVDLSLENKEITHEIALRLRKYIESYKNVRTVLDDLELSYLQKHKQTIHTGGVGEVSITTEMIEGYEQLCAGVQNIRVGAVGETAYYAVQEV